MKEIIIDEGSSRLISIKRGGGKVIEVREKQLSPLGNLVAEMKFLLGRFGIGYASHLCYWRYPKERQSKWETGDIFFADFKASSRPDKNPPMCKVCDHHLKWKPSPYAFVEGEFNYVVPEIGWWKCPSGHPGEVHIEDFRRYASLPTAYRSTL
ncbi:MAG: hypothetical protein Q7R43_04505 [Candidatus Daviesbacteria bacterium]|nr:hypothetical protein [Candidatus Daviesbacteria bacterium]